MTAVLVAIVVAVTVVTVVSLLVMAPVLRKQEVATEPEPAHVQAGIDEQKRVADDTEERARAKLREQGWDVRELDGRWWYKKPYETDYYDGDGRKAPLREWARLRDARDNDAATFDAKQRAAAMRGAGIRS